MPCQLSKLAISIAVSVTVTVAGALSQPSLPQLPRYSATKSRGLPYNFVIGWCGGFFHYIGKGVSPFLFFFWLQTLPALERFREKNPFLSFLTAPNAQQT